MPKRENVRGEERVDKNHNLLEYLTHGMMTEHKRNRAQGSLKQDEKEHNPYLQVENKTRTRPSSLTAKLS